jgi:hypothetical protein
MKRMSMAIVHWLKHFFAGGLARPARTGHDRNGHTNGTPLILPQATSPLTNNSYTERAAAWANHAHLSKDAQLREWEGDMDRWFTRMSPGELAFLTRILNPACRQAGQNGQTVATVTPSAKALYRTFMLEAAGDIHFFVRRIVETNTPAQIAQQRQLIEDLAKIYGFQTAKRALPLIMALINSHSQQSGHASPRTPSFVLGTDHVTKLDLELSQEALTHSVFFLGQSGMGKSNAMLHLARYHLENGHGLILIDPHGPLTRDVIASIPKHRLEEVDLLDLMDCGEFPFSLNVFECDDPGNSTEVAKVANAVFHIFEKAFGLSSLTTPLMAQTVRHICYTMVEAGLTLREVPLLLWDDAVRKKITANLSNSHTRLFWEQYNIKSPREKSEQTNSFINKLDALLTQPLLANVLSQQNSTLNVPRIVDEGKILLLQLNQQFEEIGRFVGLIVMTKLLLYSFSRSATSEKSHRPCALLADEWQLFCSSSSDFARFVHEARKMNFMPAYANQSLSQLREEDIGAAMSSGTIVALRISGDDARLVARSMDATPQPVVIGEEPQRAIVSDVLSHVIARGHNDPKVAAFAMNTLQALEHYLQTPTVSTYTKEWHVAYSNGVDDTLILYDHHIQQGRKLLNQTLYTCMNEANPNLAIPILAIFVLACSQRNGMEAVLSPYVNHDNHGFFFGPFSLRDFDPSAAKFGEPRFTDPEHAARYIATVTKASRKKRWMAEAVVSMLTEFRACMHILVTSPIRVDTGNMVPKYQLRTVSDQQNYVANSLTQQPPFHARVKTLHGEFPVRLRPPAPLREELVQERIRSIKQRMRDRGVTRPAGELAEVIRTRHKNLREQAAADDAPPPTSVTSNRRRRRIPTPANT